jgi:predicted dehydrogenase
VEGEGLVRPTARRDWEEFDDGYAEGIRGSLEEFLSALDTGATPHGECRDNFQTLAMVFAALESSRTGERVSVPLE